jgi:hypothetical protein
MRDNPTPGELSQLLAREVRQVISALGLQGRMSGNRFDAVCPWSGETYTTISICLTSDRVGVWSKWNGDEKGDILELVAYIEGGGSPNRSLAVEWAKRFLGISNEVISEAERQKREKARQERLAVAKAAMEKSEKQRLAQLVKDRASAKRIWLAAKPLSEGDPVWQYLARRGIDLRLFEHLPNSIRVYESHEHRATETGEISNWPCMVCGMWRDDGSFGAIHRTWINLDNPKSKYKIAASDAKKMWPSPMGAFIPIARGFTGVDRRKAADKIDIVYVTEGVEDALALALLRPDARIDVAGSLGLFAHYPVPRCAKELRVACDNFDNVKAKTLLEKTVFSLGQRFSIPVRKNYAPEPFKDWNEILMAKVNNG